MSQPGESLAIVNASLNAASFVFLTLGYIAIRSKRRDLHRTLMLTTFALSAVFLATYLWRFFSTGPLKFEGDPTIRAIYLVILFTHMPLAISVVPLSIRAVYLGLKGRFAEHKRTTRWLYPIWTYVSITGVMVYLLLYHVGHPVPVLGK